MNNKFLSFPLVLILILFSLNLCFAQDPGIPDTVRFEPWGTYVPCPPCSGVAVVPLYVFNDESLWWIRLVLGWSGPVSCDSVWFVGERMSFFPYQGYTIDSQNRVILLGGGTLNIENPMPPGSGIIAYLHFVVEDTGFAYVYETTTPIPEDVSQFDVTPTISFRPLILTSEFLIEPQNNLPGDVDQNGKINLGDVIFLANYILKGGEPPQFLPSGDVNTDCRITLADVILIAKWYFFGHLSLQPGCAY